MTTPTFAHLRAADAARVEWACMLDGRAGATPEGNDWVATTAVVARLFDPEECAKIVALGTRHSLEPGAMTRPGLHARRCSFAWMARDGSTQWIYDRVTKAVGEANANYRFDLVGMMDPLQFTRYDAATRDEIGWHVDCGEGPNTTRKLSLTVQLSDPGDYDGGDLEFLAMPGSSFLRHQGAAILFPALLAHRVAPLTRGRRDALVAFFNGPPFR